MKQLKARILELTLFARGNFFDAGDFNYCSCRAGGGVMMLNLITDLHLQSIHQRKICQRVVVTMSTFVGVLFSNDNCAIGQSESKSATSSGRQIGHRCQGITTRLHFFMTGSPAGGQENKQQQFFHRNIKIEITV